MSISESCPDAVESLNDVMRRGLRAPWQRCAKLLTAKRLNGVLYTDLCVRNK